MKQRPIFILLTFFLALFAVVIITFVFLRTQLNEKKLQTLVSESIKNNFPDYNIEIGHIGLNLGTKFRYKIEKVSIKHKVEQPFFSNLILENVSIKFPLFFLLGKQDIDVAVEQVRIEGADFSAWRKNNYLIQNFSDKSLIIPRIINKNRVNLTVNNIKFSDVTNRPPLPIKLRALNHFVLKDLSFSNTSAFEISSSVIFTGATEVDLVVFNLVGIGHFNLGQFFNTKPINFKVLFEVKSVNNPIYAWLTNHRFQFLNDESGPFAKWNIHGSTLDGVGTAELFSDSLSVRDMQLSLNASEIAKDNSGLKNIYYLLSETLDVADIASLKANIKGDIAYHVVSEKFDDIQWISHLSSTWSDNQNTKVEVQLNSASEANSKLHYEFKVGNDLSYRKVNVECSALLCTQDDLLTINIDFYNQIFMKSFKQDLQQIHQDISKWWSSLSSLVSEKLTTPIKFVWRKTRWGDFEFDLLSDNSMNKNMLASDNMIIKQSNKDLAKLKFSLSNSDDGILWRQYCEFLKFPSAIAAKLFSVNNLEFNGEVSGTMALELNSNKKSVTTDLTFVNGSIQWLNFDDLYRRSIYDKPEDEINYPALNWSSQFAKARLFTQWDEKEKVVEFDFLLPKKIAKNLIFKTKTSDSDFDLSISFPGLSLINKKYLQKKHPQSVVNLSFSNRDTELKLLDSEVATESKEPITE